MELETLTGIREWAYIIFTGFMVVLLYSYIYYLYNSEKKGEKDYEKYADIALHDEVTDLPVEDNPKTLDKKDKE